MTLTQTPGTQATVVNAYSNDAGTLVQEVSPSNPLPVTGTFIPSGTQDTNLKQVNGAAVNVGIGASSTGTQRVAVASDSTIATVTNAVGVKGTDGSTIASSTNPVPVGSQTSSTLIASQVTVPATANGIQILASNASRKGASIVNPGPLTVYIQQASTGVTTSNGYAILAGAALNIDNPLYTGAVYGIISSGTQTITVLELT